MYMLQSCSASPWVKSLVVVGGGCGLLLGLIREWDVFCCYGKIEKKKKKKKKNFNLFYIFFLLFYDFFLFFEYLKGIFNSCN